MKKIILTIAICWLCTNLYAQNTLEGTVKNSENEPLANAYISIPELKLTTLSNSEGTFVLKNIPKGKFLMQITYQGFESFSKTLKFPFNDNLEIAMTPSIREMDEVVILGQSYKEKTQTTYPVSSLDRKKMHTNGGFGLSEALSTLPGIALFSNGPGISKPVLHGLTGSRISIVNNGFAISQQQWQNEHGMLLFDAGIDRVQVIKGPASLLYGEGAFGGTVQLIPENEAPVGKVLGDINASMLSNTIGLNLDAGVKGSSEKLSWIIRAGGQSHGDYYSSNTQRAPNTRNAAYLFQGTMNFHRKNGVSTVNYNYTNSTSGIIEAQELLVPEQETRFEREFEGPHHMVQLHNVNFKNSFFLGTGKLNLNLNAQLNNRQEVEGMEENSVDIGDLEVHSNTFVEQATYTKNLGSNSDFTLGVEAKQQKFENLGERRLIPDADLSSISGYAVTNWDLGKLQLQGGFRYDFKQVKTEGAGTADTLYYYQSFEKTFDQYNGNVGLNWTMTDHLTTKFNIGAGSRVPNLAELASDGIHEGTTRYEIGNSDLKFERNIQYDLALEAKYPYFGLLVDVYYNDINDFIYLQESNEMYFGFTKYYFTQQNASFKGIDIGLDWALGQSIQLNHTFSAVEAKTDDGAYLPFIPAFSLLNTVNINLPLKGKFSETNLVLSSRHYFKQDKVAENETETEGYSLIDLGVNTQLEMGNKTVLWSLKVTNLLDEKYFNHLSFIKDLGVPNMGRNVVLSAHIPLNFR
ncbi:MAG TPA: TonB-dependent receptor [Fulvivirga sp.]|nr:TonB-dependent receptor [Fulvivirga sp.]